MYDPADIKILFNNENTRQNINGFLNNATLEVFKVFNNSEEIAEFFTDKDIEFLEKSNTNELDKLRDYSAAAFRFVNAVLRDSWNYEEHGSPKEGLVQEYRLLAEQLERIIYKYPPLDFNFVTYRGVNQKTFHNYGISELTDLYNLKNQYLYDAGFTSTSLLQSSSFFQRPLGNGINYNVLIKYHITKDNQVGVLLNNELASCSPQQDEFLINAGSLVKVLNVQINEENNTAVLDVILIPSQVWDPNRMTSYNESRSI